MVRPTVEKQVSEDIEQWRFDELCKRGVRPLMAYTLSEQRDIIHRLDELLDNGCPLDTAIRILR